MGLSWEEVAPAHLPGSTLCHCVDCRFQRTSMNREQAMDGLVQSAAPTNSLPDDATKRNEYPMADGLLDYFPNALAEVSRLSHLATLQHHPDQPMHWDRSKSSDHRNKIMRHLIDAGGLDDKGLRHSTMVAWRSLALLQDELEREGNLPASRASRNRPF